ncbi:hypothetical protein DPV78_009704 [Talaromyces pinophilus]|nr:hypothetical protein DPV78_009704 [Talaromyces pinophilus]
MAHQELSAGIGHSRRHAMEFICLCKINSFEVPTGNNNLNAHGMSAGAVCVNNGLLGGHKIHNL